MGDCLMCVIMQQLHSYRCMHSSTDTSVTVDIVVHTDNNYTRLQFAVGHTVFCNH